MDWQQEFIQTISNFVKLVGYMCFHGGSLPSYSMITNPVFRERNRLIVQGNERLKRIEDLESQYDNVKRINRDVVRDNESLYVKVEDLEAEVKNLRGCNDDLRDMIDELYT